MIDIRPVVQAISKLSVAMGGLMLLPAAVDWSVGDPNWRAFAAAAAGTPGLAGIPWVARPEPASARRPSTWPW